MARDPDVLEIKITEDAEASAGPTPDASVATMRPADRSAIHAVAAEISIEGVKSIAGRLKSLFSEAVRAITPDGDAARRLGEIRVELASLHHSARATSGILRDRNASPDDFLEAIKRRRAERDQEKLGTVRPQAEPPSISEVQQADAGTPQSLADVRQDIESLHRQAKSDRKLLSDPSVSSGDFLEEMQKRRAARQAAQSAPSSAHGAASAASRTGAASAAAARSGAAAAAAGGGAGAAGTAGAAAGAAAGGAGAGAGAASAIAALAAAAAPIAAFVAVAAVAVAGLGALVAATSRLIDRFDSLAGRYENYDPAVAGASAQREAMRELGNLRRANLLGDDLADFIRARGRGEQAMADLASKFDFVMLRLTVPLLESAVGLLERISAAVDTIDLDKFSNAAGFAFGEAFRVHLMQMFGAGVGNLLFQYLQKQLAKLREEALAVDNSADKFFDDFFGDGKGNPGMTVPFGAVPPVLPPIPVPPAFPNL